MSRTVAIVGGGPTGIVAALYAKQRGFVPTVLEAGPTVGSSLARYGEARFFSPLSMNLPAPALALAADVLGERMPAPDAILTGPATATVLDALARSKVLAEHVHCNHRVVSIRRGRLSRGDLAGHPVRAELPFRLTVAAEGREHTLEADAVLDASGTYGTPVPLLGPGAAFADAVAIRDLGALAEAQSALEGKRVLLVGHGHSAANALATLAAIAERAPATRVTWAVRSRNLRPLEAVPADPLPERARVLAFANGLASKPPPWLAIERNAAIESFAKTGEGLAVTLAGARSVVVDRVIALVGYRPNHALTAELPLEISPVTEGAMRLQRALANVRDCLSVPSVAPTDLASGEPRFHLAGAKSYGRARTFLLQTGYAQLETILDGLFAEA